MTLRGKTLTEGITLVIETCCVCGTPFAMEQDLNRNLRNKHTSFYCPNGHGQSYTGESDKDHIKRLSTEKEALEAQLRREKDARDREVGELRNQIQKTARRVNHGVCPHCQRTVSQLARHMKAKHPEMV